MRRLDRIWGAVWPIAAGACLVIGGAAVVVAAAVELIKVVTSWR
jgi:hypothetical protein